VGRKVVFVCVLAVLPGALTALCVLWLARVLVRTRRGRRLIERMTERLPSWLATPLRALQGKDFPRLGETAS
jgi:hypothetical protein